MNAPLPMTGTTRLLTLLDRYIPDDFINEHWNVRPARGPHRRFSAAQLWRVHLLTVLTPVHALNLLVAMLPEQRAWRQFARLAHRRDVPDVRMLHEFRARVGVAGLRAINDVLRDPLVERAAGWEHAVALMDATDLEAACRGFKKKTPRPTRRTGRRWVGARSRPGKAAGSWVTRNTRSVCGGGSTPPGSC
ncbi:MAG: hypothetical protein HYY24_25090 [Verrucomicrobia bacterium]|nr:hypothetical protein [Verrucomicrobiota bacterium]